MRKIALAVLAVLSSTGGAQAATTIIGFQPLALASSVPVTYTESGYTIQSNNTRLSVVGTTVNGTLTVQKFVGSTGTGIPSVNFARSTSFSLTGGTFTFDGLAAYFGTINGVSSSFNVAGFLLDKELYSMEFTATGGTAQASGFRDFTSGSSSIFDKLVFTAGGTSGQLVLDDIKVSAATLPTPTSTPDGPGSGGPTPGPVAAVPEPATWAMMLLGFGLVGGTMRRRKQQIAVRFA